MKITFVSNNISIFIEELIENLRKTNSFNIYNLFIYHKPNEYILENNLNYNLYAAKLNFRNDIVKDKILGFPIKIFKYFVIKRIIREQLKCDILHIQYLSPTNRFFWKSFKKISQKIVITIWGSDFYQATNKTKKKLKKMIKECDAITFTNPIMVNDFLNYYKDIDLSNKIHVIPFGLKVLDILKNKLIISEQARKDLGFPQNKIVLVVGYSSNPIHQQAKIINLLNTLDPIYKDKLFLVLPMTYGNDEYRSIIEKLLFTSEIKSTILKEFMSYENIAKLRVATDIMINLPITDQFSGTMQEHMYAGSIVITGSWLPYHIFWEKGVYAEIISTMDNLTNKLLYVLENLNELRDKTKKNKKIIWELSSWEK
ncbi:MAG: glycosyltransferase, partial [Spirochaetota bacterium]